jgi:predicted amino acid dehydrogenase
MNLEKLSKRVTQELDSALSADFPADEREAIVDIVRRAMLDSSSRTTREMKETAVACCGAEADLAHKIQENMDKRRDLLVTNLMAMR